MKPISPWEFFTAALIGVLVGVGAFTFHYAHGFSYLSKDPRACVNCHIMNPEFSSWQKASHHSAATCVDCHLPHSLIPKYLSKADNGYRHSKGFTLQNFNEPIMITPRNSRILNANCLRCHEQLTHGLAPVTRKDPDALRCAHCHASVGHGETTGMGRYDPKEGEPS